MYCIIVYQKNMFFNIMKVRCVRWSISPQLFDWLLFNTTLAVFQLFYGVNSFLWINFLNYKPFRSKTYLCIKQLLSNLCSIHSHILCMEHISPVFCSGLKTLYEAQLPSILYLVKVPLLGTTPQYFVLD